MEYNWDTKTILVVEDEPVNYLFIEKILKPTHAIVLRAENGNEAVDMVLNNKEIDIVLMDIYMPGMDGFEASYEIKTKKPNMPVIAQTFYESHIEKEQLDKADFNGFIKKPININKLLVVLDKYLKMA
ncbi:MAG: response regulator [Salinivirgaceae bacterium]|nr:response regulator [Salinivirgaceae bacterium]